jgi:hypothetical protein
MLGYVMLDRMKPFIFLLNYPKTPTRQPSYPHRLPIRMPT